MKIVQLFGAENPQWLFFLQNTDNQIFVLANGAAVVAAAEAATVLDTV